MIRHCEGLKAGIKKSGDNKVMIVNGYYWINGVTSQGAQGFLREKLMAISYTGAISISMNINGTSNILNINNVI